MTCNNDCIHGELCLKRQYLSSNDELHAEECCDFKNKGDVREIKHGEWVFINQAESFFEPPYGDTCKCSVCQYEIDVAETVYNFCPNCGAIMDGGNSAKK